MKAMWRGRVLAESDDTVVVDGDHYFPMDSLNMEFFRPSSRAAASSWKGTASYYTVEVDEQESVDAAWYYERPTAAAAELEGRVAFGNDVAVIP